MERALEDLVWQRARNRCEYCQIPQSHDRLPFDLDVVDVQVESVEAR